MLKFTQSDYVDVDLYEKHLGYNGYVAYDRDSMLQSVAYEGYHASSLAALATDIMIHRSAWRCSTLQTAVIQNYLINYEHCPESYFKKKGVQGLSLDANKVLGKLRANGYATEFIDQYVAYKSLKSKCSTIKGITDRQKEYLGENKDGIPLYKLEYSFKQQKNTRYNYSNEDIIGIPKEYNNCICVEDGYFLAWGDFAQSDFRIAYNLFIRSPENDILMGKYEDKYEALARIVASAEGKKFDLEQFKKDRPLYKQLTLATIYGTRSSRVAEEDKFVKMFYSFLQKCPKYVEYEKRLHARAKLGVPILVKSYFGHVESIAIQYKEEQTVNDALNSPVQSCTSQVVMLTVNKIMDLFQSLGYSEDDVSVYYVRHDEPVFKIKQSVLKDIWVLNQASEIIVDNWSPLAMSFNYGYYYKKPDSDLELAVQQIYMQNGDKIAQYEVSKETATEYYPVPPILQIVCVSEKTPDGKAIVCAYDPEHNAVAYFLCYSDDEDSITEFMKKSILAKADVIYQKGYRGVYVSNKVVEEDAVQGHSLFRFMIRDDGDTLAACKFCRYMVLRYCKTNKLETDLVPPQISDESMIVGAKELF